MFIEFRDLIYSLVEDNRIYNVTIVRQGEPGEDIVVAVSPNPDPTSFDSAECKGYVINNLAVVMFLAHEL